MKVLVACEFSGIVRDAFLAKGHDAISCDLLPTERPTMPVTHYQGNVLDLLNKDYGGWDLMIAHPPCTYISFAATGYWDRPGRARKRLHALDFFLTLWEAPIEKICIENPLGCADVIIQKHDQIIHPHYFGDSDNKRTCLWLKNLPKLQYSLNDNLFELATSCEKPEPIYTDKKGKKRYRTDSLSGGNGRERSRFFPSIAKAMADQWG